VNVSSTMWTESSSVPRRALVVAAYAVSFFGALPALLWAMGGQLDALLGLAPLVDVGLRVAGAALATIGAAWTGWSMLWLSRLGKGLPISHLPPEQLVARGPYAWMRHPIYVGYAALVSGSGLVAGSAGRGVGALFLLAAGTIIYVFGFEEPRLRRRFGAGYAAYAQEVPAFPLGGFFARAALAAWRLARPVVEALANRPVLARIGPTVWVSYGAFAGLGAAVGLSIWNVLIEPWLSARFRAGYAIGIALWMLLGARVVALLYQPRLLANAPLESLRRVGFVSWGGYLGLFTFPFLFAGLTGADGWILLDCSFVGALACSAVGRIGCLTYGCCYGRPSPHGVVWRHPEAKVNRERPCAHREPRIATQVLSSAHAFALVPIIALLTARGAPGTATAVGALLYSLGRFGVECLRDEPRFGPLRLTRGQIASAIGGGLAVGVLLLLPAAGPPTHASAAAISSEVGAWVAIAVAAACTFVCCSMHWRRVGSW